MRINDFLLRLIGARVDCPYDEEFLAYSEDRISPRARARIERHVARCEDCRDVLAFLARESDYTPVPLTERAVSQQTGMILGYIAEDEREHRKSARRPRTIGGFSISYPKLASAALAICGVFWMVQMIFVPSAAELATKAMKSGLERERYTLARVSGGIDYSSFSHTRGAMRGGDGTETRGSDQSDADLRFRQASNLLSSASQKEDAPVNERLTLAKVYVALGTLEDAKRALDILAQLSSRGMETPELFNDMGVAHFRLEKYENAIELFTKAIDKSPGYNEALFNRAMAEEQIDSYGAAQRDWQQYISQAPDDGWKAEAVKHLESVSAASEK